MVRGRPYPPLSRPRPEPKQKQKDPLGEELGDYREDLEDQHFLPDSWYALTDEERQLQEPYRDYSTTADTLGISDEVKADVRRKERIDPYTREEVFPDLPPGRVWGDVPPTPLTTQDTESVSEALQATDKIDVNLGHEDKDVADTHHHMIMNRIIQIKTSRGFAYEQDGRRLHPCEALENDGFNINMRRHVKTGNGKRRLAQIRRQYAYMNCR